VVRRGGLRPSPPAWALYPPPDCSTAPAPPIPPEVPGLHVKACASFPACAVGVPDPKAGWAAQLPGAVRAQIQGVPQGVGLQPRTPPTGQRLSPEGTGAPLPPLWSIAFPRRSPPPLRAPLAWVLTPMPGGGLPGSEAPGLGGGGVRILRSGPLARRGPPQDPGPMLAFVHVEPYPRLQMKDNRSFWRRGRLACGVPSPMKK